VARSAPHLPSRLSVWSTSAPLWEQLTSRGWRPIERARPPNGDRRGRWYGAAVTQGILYANPKRLPCACGCGRRDRFAIPRPTRRGGRPRKHHTPAERVQARRAAARAYRARQRIAPAAAGAAPA
jgi:hypothetical protein